jgi:uncharacterized membrane protein YcaP (DUF421 family)
MNINTNYEGLCANIIIDGILLENNLSNMDKDKTWLDNEIKKRGYRDYSSILLLTLDDNNKINIYDKNVDSNMRVLE